MGWWIALAIVVGLVILPLGVSARYNADGVWAAVLVGPIRVKLFPRKKREKKKDKPPREDPVASKPAQPVQKPRQQPQTAKKEEPAVPPDIPLHRKYPNLDKKPGKIPKKPPVPQPEQPEQGGSWKDFLSLVPVVLDFLGDFRRKLRVNRLELRLVLAADDPCDLAIHYGKAWAAVGNLMPQLERVFRIRKRNVEVMCDFLASETTVIARVDLTITLGRLTVAVSKFAFHALVEFLKIKKIRKGGAVK